MAASLAFMGLFALLVALEVHGLSIGCWDDSSLMPPAPEGYRYRQFGKPREIRADDWNVSVPQIMAQCQSPEFFPRVNRRVDLGRDMFASTPCNPVWDATAPAQPHNWGFFLFGAGRGFAWSWWLRFLGLPLCAFATLRRRLGGDARLAAAGAIAVTFGAPTQWWDTSLPYLLLYGFASLLFLDTIRESRGALPRFAAAIAFACSSAAYFLSGYPAFALLLLPAFLIVATPGGSGQPRATAPGAAPATAAAIAGGAALVAVAIAIHCDTLRLVAASSYPGMRVFHGGSPALLLRRMGLGLIGPALPFDSLRPDLAAFGATNPCTAARWFVPLPALAVALLDRRCRSGLRDWILCIYAAVLASWAFLPWPTWLSRAACLSKIPPQRAEVALGFVLLLLCLRAVAWRRGSSRRTASAISALLAILAVACVLWHGRFGAFPTTRAAAVVAAFAGLAVTGASYGLLAARRAVFCAAIACFSLLSGATVHPIARGLAPMRDKPFADLARSIDGEEPGRWLANTSTTGNFLLAQGLDCIAGVQAYAVPAMWRAIDPDGANRRAWNRYAHTIVDIQADGGPLAATAISDDHLRYSLDERAIRALGVRHIVWSGKKLHLPWLRYDGRMRLHFFYTVLSGEKEYN